MDGHSYAGIDWASRKHALCVVDGSGEPLANEFHTHTEAGIGKLIARMQDLGVCRVAIERPDGLLVDRLLETDVAVMPVNPRALKATRPRYQAAAVKSDPFDAFCLAELARTDSHRYRTLRPDSDETRTLRMLTRSREHLVRLRVHVANQLRAQLGDFWPGPAQMFSGVDGKIGLAFLRRYPSPADARDLNEEQLAEFLKAERYSPPGHPSVSELLERLRSAPGASVGEAETEAGRATVLGLVRVLEPIVTEISDLNSRISRRTRVHPDSEIFLPLFKSSTPITVAVLIAQIGDDRARYPSADVLAAKAGMVPVTRASGTQKVTAFRYGCDKRLRGAVSILANSTRYHNPWARGIYEAARERGHNHPHALRILGRAWLRVIWRCWQDEVPYDPAKHGNLRRLQSSSGSWIAAQGTTS